MAIQAFTPDLFGGQSAPDEAIEQPLPAVHVLRAFAAGRDAELRAAIEAVLAHAPWRHLATPGGKPMSVAMTGCGPLGWTSDRHGYRYSPVDPLSGRPWPEMPRVLRELARDAAAHAGHAAFEPDACLINRYVVGARMGLHQDRDERDFSHPIVSVSLGIPALFVFGGARRSDPVTRIGLLHGDVVVWGGPARLHFHGVRPLKPAWHDFYGAERINLTFRRAG